MEKVVGVMRWKRVLYAGFGLGLVLGTVAGAQTLATGDSRTVSEPLLPPVCTTLNAQQAIVNGGPASETTFDTSRLQTALTGCGAGNAVELAVSGSSNAFLIAPITIPTGVGLIVDGGVTVFASRNPADYQTSSTEKCGSYGASGNGCNPLIGVTSTNSGSGIYGYGVIDGRGGSTILSGGVDTGVTWWANADAAATAGSNQDNPVMLSISKSTNFTLYKITLRNSPHFHVVWSGNGLTAWGAKIVTPFSARNTDGIDPSGTNVTVNLSSISDGDDNFAINASSAGSNMTVENTNTYSGHGISIGSYTQGGFTNLLVNNVNMAGTASDTNATGIRLKSSEDRGGLVQTITYENMCLKDIRHILQFTPFYNTNAGTLYPSFQNIVLSNVHFLTPTTNQYPYLVQMEGFSANYISTITLQNVVFDSLVATNVTPASQYDTFALSGNVYPAFLQSLPGTGVSYTGSATATAGAGVSSCTGVFPYVAGDLYLSTATATSLQSTTVPANASVTLNAMVQPAMSQVAYSGTAGASPAAAALTQAVNFYEGTTLKGAGTIGGNGTIASLTLSGLTVGTHTYTAQYPGDTNYSALTFGSVTVTATTVPTTTTLALSTAASYPGATVTLTATVVPATTGTVTFLVNGSAVGTGAVNASGVGTYVYTVPTTATGTVSITASYAAFGVYGASATTTPQSLVVSPAFQLTSSASAVPIAAGSSGTVTLSLLPGGGFTGAVALSCSSPVSYVTCSVAITSVPLSGTSATPVTATIKVASTISMLGFRNGIWLAMTPCVLLAFGARKRKLLQQICMMMALAFVAAAASGCGGSSGGSTTPSNKPTGTQIVTFTATAAGVSQSVQVAVNIQ